MARKRLPDDLCPDDRRMSTRVDAVWAAIENKRLIQRVIEQSAAALLLEVPREFDALLPKQDEKWG